MSLADVFSTSVVERPQEVVDTAWRPQLTSELQRCETACRSCVDALVEGNSAPPRAGLALAASCAEVCQMTVALLARSDPSVGRLSHGALELCAQACAGCAEACDRLPGSAALRCADTCRAVLRAVGELSHVTEGYRLPARRGPRWSVDPVPPRAARDASSVAG